MSDESMEQGRVDLEGTGKSNKQAKGLSRLQLTCRVTFVVSISLVGGVAIGLIVAHFQLRNLSKCENESSIAIQVFNGFSPNGGSFHEYKDTEGTLHWKEYIPELEQLGWGTSSSNQPIPSKKSFSANQQKLRTQELIKSHSENTFIRQAVANGELAFVRGGLYRVDAHVTFEQNVRSSVYVGLALVEHESHSHETRHTAQAIQEEDSEPKALGGCYKGPVAFFEQTNITYDLHTCTFSALLRAIPGHQLVINYRTERDTEKGLRVFLGQGATGLSITKF